MEIEVGEYIRTKFGRILRIDSSHDMGYIEKGNPYFRQQIAKHSKRIIDLIEVGDYVNGQEVVIVYGYDEDGNDKDELGIIETDDDFAYGVYLTDLNIRTILTHEQYEQNAYRLEEK